MDIQQNSYKRALYQANDRFKRHEAARKAKRRKLVAERVWHLYCLKMQHNPPDEKAVRAQVLEELGLDSMPFLNTIIEEKLASIGAPVETIMERHLLVAMHEIKDAQAERVQELEAQIIEHQEIAEKDPLFMVVVEQTETAKGTLTKKITIQEHLRKLHAERASAQETFLNNVAKLTPRNIASAVVGGNKNVSTMTDDDLNRAIEYERAKINLAIPVEPEEVQ